MRWFGRFRKKKEEQELPATRYVDGGFPLLDYRELSQFNHEKERKMSASKFKRGDRVRHVSGKMGTVLKVFPNGDPIINVGTVDGGVCGFEHEFTRIDEPRFKIGEWVRHIDGAFHGCAGNGDSYVSFDGAKGPTRMTPGEMERAQFRGYPVDDTETFVQLRKDKETLQRFATETSELLHKQKTEKQTEINDLRAELETLKAQGGIYNEETAADMYRELGRCRDHISNQFLAYDNTGLSHGFVSNGVARLEAELTQHINLLKNANEEVARQKKIIEDLQARLECKNRVDLSPSVFADVRRAERERIIRKLEDMGFLKVREFLEEK